MSFYDDWHGKGNEISDTQKFWLQLLHDVLGVRNPFNFINFEKPVKGKNTYLIDAYIPRTKILIEQKSQNIDLNKPIKQADGVLRTPIEQAWRYYGLLKDAEKGRYIIVCNFKEMHIYEIPPNQDEPKTPQLQRVITLADFERKKHTLRFLVSRNVNLPLDEELSIEAGDYVKKFRDGVIADCKSRKVKPDIKSINLFCVRLVFLLFAEDAGLLGDADFREYLTIHKTSARDAILKLFLVLSQKMHERDPYLNDKNPKLAAFPYIDGGLFQGSAIDFPEIDGSLVKIILDDMGKFNWQDINPTIFGAIFEQILSDRDKKGERAAGGMHYTRRHIIHKAIDPLFMDDLRSEFDSARKSPAKSADLQALREKLTALRFLDPACGSGNFLTETYLSLCELEREIISELNAEESYSVSLAQFFGIEINDFAVNVARVSMWIAQIQAVLALTNGKPAKPLLPLKDSAHIHHENALRKSWRDILPDKQNVFIISNPPFIGSSGQNSQQKKEVDAIYLDADGKSTSTAGKIDYVAAWYYLAGLYMQGTTNKAAFVSSNSIVQGEQVGYVWEPLLDVVGIHIDFAVPSFLWDSDVKDVEEASVFVVVVGFSVHDDGKPRRIIYADGVRYGANISPYLVIGRNVIVHSAVKALTDGVPYMRGGNRPMDGGKLLLTQEERDEMIKKCPKAEKWIKQIVGGYEFLHNVPRYCLWLIDATPKDLAGMPPVMERIKLCREDRLNGAPDRQKLANTSWLFRDKFNPKKYLAIPTTSSERRYYIPMGFLDESVIPGDGLMIIPDADLYTFGVLTSSVHMAWTRRVCGRLKMDYRYSAQVVYNPFVWPGTSGQELVASGQDSPLTTNHSPLPTNHYALITRTAQGILSARAMNPESSYAELYNDLLMPPALRSAHEENDRAVMEAYGFAEGMSEDEIVSELLERYEVLAARKAKRKK